MSRPRKYVPLLLATTLVAALSSKSALTMSNDPGVPAPHQVTVRSIGIESPDSPPDWRQFFHPTAHPDGEHLYFVECQKNLGEYCRILRLHLPTSMLSYYQMPPGHVYLHPRLSPSGKKLALIRAPVTPTPFPGNLERHEIAIMNIDGGDLEVLPLASGFKTRPSFNADESRLAFWRAMPDIKDRNKPTAYDIYEYDFHERQESAFGPRYRFHGGGEIHYLPGGDEVLVEADIPLDHQARFNLDGRTYIDRYPNPIFRLRRGETQWVPPIFADESFKGARRLHRRPDGAMTFYVPAPPGHSLGRDAILVYYPDTGFQRWNQEGARVIFGTSRPAQLVMLNEEIIGVYHRYSEPENNRAKRFLALNTNTGILRALPIPALSTASPIPVSFKPGHAAEPHRHIDPNRPPLPFPAAPPMKKHRFLRTACGGNMTPAIRTPGASPPTSSRTTGCSTP